MSDSWLGLNIGASALRAFQQALSVVQHNVSNASTEGYTRQRAVLSPMLPETMPYGEVGRGVELTAIVQTRDVYLDYNVRKETQTAGMWEAKQNVYQEMQVIFNEPSDAGFSSVMADFWNSWQNLGNDPDDPSIRTNLLDKAGILVDSFKQIDNRLKSLQSITNEDVISNVNSVNGMARQIADLNEQIRKVESTGIAANDLRDSRNLLIDQMNKIVPVTVYDNADHTVNVTINGEFLVSNVSSYEIKAVPRTGDPNGTVDLKWKDTGNALTPASGKLAGLLEMRDTVIPGYISQMNTLAAGIVNQVNAVHRTGMGLDATKKLTGGKDFTGTLSANGSVVMNGITVNFMAGDNLATIAARLNAAETDTGVHASTSGNRLVLEPAAVGGKTIKIDSDPDSVMLNLGILNNFFTGTSADTIGIDPAVKSNANLLAASLTGAPGDGQIASRIAGLKDLRTTMSGGTNTFDQYYNASMASLGVHVTESGQMAKNQTLVLQQLDEMRQSNMGVNLDEEMIKMMEFQRGYEAAAKLITTIDEMITTLINMKS